MHVCIIITYCMFSFIVSNTKTASTDNVQSASIPQDMAVCILDNIKCSILLYSQSKEYWKRIILCDLFSFDVLLTE